MTVVMNSYPHNDFAKIATPTAAISNILRVRLSVPAISMAIAMGTNQSPTTQ
jgi:hypothetical protein